MRGLVEGQVRLGEWKDVLMQDPTKLMDAYLASAQGQGLWSGAADGRRRCVHSAAPSGAIHSIAHAAQPGMGKSPS
jgi:hypothetical protein